MYDTLTYLGIVDVLDSLHRTHSDVRIGPRRALSHLADGLGLTAGALRETFTTCDDCGNVVLRDFLVGVFHRCCSYHEPCPLYPNLSVFTTMELNYVGMTKEVFRRWLTWCDDCEVVLPRATCHSACPGRLLSSY